MARAHGKIILLGEHGVVYGRPAIAFGIDRGVAATAEPADELRLTLAPSGASVTPASSEPLGRAFAALVAAHPNRGPDVHVRAQVDLPVGAGLGCSAALGVAVVRALDEAWSFERPAEQAGPAARPWEAVFHGTPSGIDSTVAAAPDLILFRMQQAPEPIRCPVRLQVVVADGGERAPTRAMVEAVARQRGRAEGRIDQVFDGMASIVQNGRLALMAGDLPQLGQLMTLNQALLNTLMVSTARLEELCAEAREAGALGAKLTGGGGGGCIVALVADDAAAERVELALRAQGADVFCTDGGRAP